MSSHDPQKILEVLDRARNHAPARQLLEFLKNFSSFIPHLGSLVHERISPLILRDYQELTAKKFDRSSRPIFAVEIGPGCGKTLIACRVAEGYLKAGKKVLFIGCNDMSVVGIIRKFREYFRSREMTVRLPDKAGDANHLNDIFFFTGHSFHTLHRRDWKSFRLIAKDCQLLVVDECHHFPDATETQLKRFHKVAETALKEFKKEGKRVLSLTATHGRMDGLAPLGVSREDLDVQINLKATVEKGYTPPIFGIEVIQEVNAKVSIQGHEAKLKFKTDDDRNAYLNKIVKTMVEVWKQYPLTTCAFVSTIKDAEYLCETFNRETGLGDKGLWPLTCRTSASDRESLTQDIHEGKKLGYVTCSLGSESLDIPRIQIIHLIRRTKSPNLLLQSIGRGTRLWDGKKWLLLIDYAVLKEKVIKHCLGLMDFGRLCGLKNPTIQNGGKIISAKSVRTPPSETTEWSYKLGALQAWVAASKMDKMVAEYVSWFDKHHRKPMADSKDAQEKKLGIFRRRYHFHPSTFER